MAVAYVTEFPPGSSPVTPVYFQAAQAPPLVEQSVVIGAGSLPSAAFGPSTGLVRVHVDVIAQVTFGAPGAAVGVNSMRMIAGQTEYFVVKPGQVCAVKAAT